MEINQHEKYFELQHLSKVLQYRNDGVVYRFLNEFNISEKEAHDIFNEMLKWLYLKAYSLYETQLKQKITHLSITKALIIIDEMWHCFILHTKDYNNFCEENFNRMIHHKPAVYVPKEQHIIRKSIEIEQPTIERIEELASYVYDKYGEETASKWFEIYPRKYNINNLYKLKLNSWKREY